MNTGQIIVIIIGVVLGILIIKRGYFNKQQVQETAELRPWKRNRSASESIAPTSLKPTSGPNAPASVPGPETGWGLAYWLLLVGGLLTASLQLLTTAHVSSSTYGQLSGMALIAAICRAVDFRKRGRSGFWGAIYGYGLAVFITCIVLFAVALIGAMFHSSGIKL